MNSNDMFDSRNSRMKYLDPPPLKRRHRNSPPPQWGLQTTPRNSTMLRGQSSHIIPFAALKLHSRISFRIFVASLSVRLKNGATILVELCLHCRCGLYKHSIPIDSTQTTRNYNGFQTLTKPAVKGQSLQAAWQGHAFQTLIEMLSKGQSLQAVW